MRGLPGWFLHLVFMGLGRLLDGVAQQLRPHPVEDPAGEGPPEALLVGGDAARPVQPFPAPFEVTSLCSRNPSSAIFLRKFMAEARLT